MKLKLCFLTAKGTRFQQTRQMPLYSTQGTHRSFYRGEMFKLEKLVMNNSTAEPVRTIRGMGYTNKQHTIKEQINRWEQRHQLTNLFVTKMEGKKKEIRRGEGV